MTAAEAVGKKRGATCETQYCLTAPEGLGIVSDVFFGVLGSTRLEPRQRTDEKDFDH
jgi:hypothetical protein